MRLVLVGLSILKACPGVIASPHVNGLEADFVRNNTLLGPNEVASNVFRLKNSTSNPVRFHLNYSVPSGWAILSQIDKEYQMAANDSIFLPVRIVPDKNIKGGTSYIITVSMITDKNVQFASENWYVSLPIKSNWTAQLPFKNQFFMSSVDSSGFYIHLQNDGNADEQIRIVMNPDRRLEVLRNVDHGLSPLMLTIPLAAGTDTTLIFPVIRRPSTLTNQNKDADLKTAPSKETYSIQISAKSTSGYGSWSGTMQFTKAGNLARFYEYGHASIPLTLEANVYDILSSGTTMSLDAYGNTTFAHDRMLNYRFQSVFITNYLNENSFLGNNQYIGYFDRKASLEVGEVNGWGRSLLTGRGIKGSYILGVNTVGAMYTRSPGFFKNYRSEGYGFYHNLKLNRIVMNNFYSHNSTNTNGLSSDLVNSTLTSKLNVNHHLSFGGGYSIDHAFSQIATGYGFEVNYSGSFKDIMVMLGGSYGTPSYILARGVKMYTGRISWSKDKNNNFAFTAQNFTQRPSYFSNNSLITGYYIRADRYELRWGINTVNSSIAIKPTYQWDENPSFRVATRLLGIEYNAKNISQVRFSLMGSMGYAKAVDYSVPDFFVSRFSAFARWEKMYVSVRYTYGPYQILEQKRFVNDGINPQTLNLVGTYDYWLKGNKFLLSTTGNLLYETYFKKYNFRIRPELFYYSRNGLRFSFYASFFSTTQGANPLYEERQGYQPYQKITDNEMTMGFGVRKQFGIPIPGKKFNTIHVIIFKDLNGNHKQDPNEEGVENVLVNINAKSLFNVADDSSSVKNDNGESFISDLKGEIIYENIPSGIYKIKCVSLVTNGEWFDGGDNEFKIDSKKTIYIPLTKGVRVTGSLLIDRDKYTTNVKDIDLSLIRVTALDSSGKTYSVLTNNKGEFIINLPAGQYVLTINEAALGNDFIFIQNKINLDLTRNFENFSITFNAVERKRKMEIKKFDNNK